MATRMLDWECLRCGTVHEETVEVPSKAVSPKTARLACGPCGKVMNHRRLPPLIAKYLGDRDHSPMIHGGINDTAGAKRPEVPMPEGLLDGKTVEETVAKFEAPETREWLKSRKATNKENAEKKKRMAAIKAGEKISIKHNKLPGDPKL